MEEPEVRYRDPVFERLVSQIWSDFQYKLNTESQLYGTVLDPFDVDAKLPEPIDIHQVGTGYTAEVQMHGIKVREISVWPDTDPRTKVFNHSLFHYINQPFTVNKIA